MIIGIQTIKGLKIEELLTRAINYDFQAFEIFFDGFYPEDLSADFKNKLKEKIFQNNIYLTVHAPLFEQLDNSVKNHLYNSLSFAQEMNAHILTIHPILPLREFTLFLNNFLLKSDDIVPYLNIGIENIPTLDVHSLNKLFLDLNINSNVGVTYDIGHAQLNENAYNYLNMLQAPILECHAHNNDGKNDFHLDLRDKRGIIPIKKIIRSLYLKKQFRGPIILEYWREGMVQTKEWLLHLDK